MPTLTSALPHRFNRATLVRNRRGNRCYQIYRQDMLSNNPLLSVNHHSSANAGSGIVRPEDEPGQCLFNFQIAIRRQALSDSLRIPFHVSDRLTRLGLMAYRQR